MHSRTPASLTIVATLLMLTPEIFAQQGGADIPRRPDGRPDLSGTYDTATLTPLQRPRKFGDRLTLTEEELAVARAEPDGIVQVFGLAPAGSDERNDRTATDVSNPERKAPPVGGDGSAGAAGNVGGYNTFWIDRGNGAFQIDGRWRTSIITSPQNGRRPPLTQAARKGGSRARGVLPGQHRHGLVARNRSGRARPLRRPGASAVG